MPAGLAKLLLHGARVVAEELRSGRIQAKERHCSLAGDQELGGGHRVTRDRGEQLAGLHWHTGHRALWVDKIQINEGSKRYNHKSQRHSKIETNFLIYLVSFSSPRHRLTDGSVSRPR